MLVTIDKWNIGDFHPLEAVGRGNETQVGENLNKII